MKVPARAVPFFLFCASLLSASLSGSPAWAQQLVRIPGITDVSVRAPVQPVTLTLPRGGTIDSVQVTTQGSPHFDFADAGGGSCAPGKAFLPGQTCTVNLLFQPLYPGDRRGAVLLLDSSGAPLATVWLTAFASGAVASFVPGTISTVAGNAAWIFGGDGAPATQTSLFLPFGLAVDAAGNLFVTDSSNSRVRRVDAATGLVSTIAGTGILGGTGDHGPASLATLSNPTGIVLDPAGNVFFSDSGNNVVRRIDAFTGVITTVAGSMGSHGYTGDSGAATAATLNGPNGLALDAAGNLYIADSGNHVIRLVNAATGTIRTLTGRGTPGYSGDGGPASAASLNGPWSVTLAASGELYIADQNNHAIRKIDLAGNISTIAGNGSVGFTGDGQPAAASQLNVPASVAIDVAGNLFIADSGNNRVRKINARTGIISTIAGNAGESFSGDNGPADQAGIYGPYTLALDGQDNLFIADVFHNRIRKISSNNATIDFPAIRVNRVSSALTQTLENDGNAPLTLTALTAVDNALLDAPTTLCQTAHPLNPLDTCVVGVDFAPTVTGNPVLGHVNLASGAANAPSTVTLSGQVLDIDPTNLTLASSANPGLTGQPVTFTVTAASAGTTPTGAVTFLDGTTPLGTVQLQAGSGTYVAASLSAGQHSITASYAGDTSNAAATSTPLLETIRDQQASTSTTLASSANPSAAGASLTLTATVNVRAQGAGTATVAGTVTFQEGSLTLGTATLDAATANLNQGTATLNLSNLAPGSHSITAAYAGNANDGPSTSASLTEVVQVAVTRLALTTSANPSIAGAPLTLTATVLGTGGKPTGSITFADGTTALGTAHLNGQGIATLQVPAANWSPGAHLLTAVYAGDANDAASSSLPFSQQVQLATTTVALRSSLNPAGLGASLTFSATVTGNGGTPAGTVQFFDGATALGSATLDDAGSASVTTATLTLGSHVLTAVYSGDPFDQPATSAPLTEAVQTATIAVTLASSKNPALFADSVTFAAVVSGSGSQPTGTVTFLDGSSPLGTGAVDASGHSSLTLATLPIGAHSLTAVYSGDSNHAAATSAIVNQAVLQTTTTTLTLPAAHSTAGLPVMLRAGVAGLQGKPITGLITLTDGSATLAALAPDATGQATYTATLAPGAHTLAASYAGDALNAPSASASASEQIDLATTSTALASSANPAAAGTALTLTATVAGNGAAPTGSITFLDGPTALSTVPVSSSGTATLTLATLAPGIHPLSATYSGDTNDSPSQSTAVPQQIALKTVLTLVSNANPSLLTDDLTLTISASNGLPGNPPTGSLVVTDNGSPLFTGPLNGGSRTVVLTSAALGQHTLVATYAGDAQNGPASSQPLLQTVIQRPSKTALTASTSAMSAGQQLILVSVVQPTAGGPSAPTGQVTFQSGTVVLGKAGISSAGVATLTITPQQGFLTIVAAYSGDTLYSQSASPAVNVVVGPPVEFNLTATPPSITLQSGQRKTLGIGLTSNGTFKDTLSFGCAGLPAYATCTFSTNQLPVASGTPQALTVVVDTGTPLGAGSSASLARTPAGPTLCLLPAAALLLLVGRRRRLRSLSLAAFTLLLGLAAGTLAGCGSTFTQSKTPPGTYTFQVVATGNQTGATGSLAVQMQVTQ